MKMLIFNVIHWVDYKMLSMTSPSLMVMNPMKSDLGLACLYHWWNFAPSQGHLKNASG
jgi:hypothetical protein